MKPETIKAIFTNVLFVIGVLLSIYGFSKGVLTGVRLAVFDTYPLASYEESRCDAEYYAPRSVPLEGVSIAPLSEQEMKQRKDKCLEGLDIDRKNKMVEDITSSVTALFAGIVLAYSFRRFIFR